MSGPVGRKRAQLRADVDTRPGQVMLLAMLAAAPLLVAFVALPVLTGATHVLAIRAALVLTPPLALWSLLVLFRSPMSVKEHNASRIGLLVDVVSLGLWLLALVPVVARGAW